MLVHLDNVFDHTGLPYLKLLWSACYVEISGQPVTMQSTLLDVKMNNDHASILSIVDFGNLA